MAQWVKNPPAWPHYRRHGLDPWVRKSLRGGNWQPVPVFLLEKSHGQRSLEDYSPKGHKESDTAERLSTIIFWQLTFTCIQNYIFSYTMEKNRFQMKTDFKCKEPLKCLCHIMGKVFITFC